MTYSKIQKICGSIFGVSLTIGIIGTILLVATGVKTTDTYWTMVWIMMMFLSVGLIGAKLYAIIWKKR